MATTGTIHSDKESSVYSRYPLDLDSDQIRVLEIHYDEWDEPIRCSIRIVSLQEKPSYRTLSYVWGDTEPRKEISIGGQPFTVGPNLFDAIRRLRSFVPETWADQDLTIWIDAVCINQGSLAERHHQVAMMHKIFSQCMEVIVWFGEFSTDLLSPSEAILADFQYDSPAREPHHVGCQCLDADWKKSEAIPWTSSSTKALTIALSVLQRIGVVQTCDDFQICRLFMNAEEISAFWLCLNFIRKSCWFTRTWVVQEFVLAPARYICMAGWLLPFTTLEWAANAHSRHSNRSCCYERLRTLRSDIWAFPLNEIRHLSTLSQERVASEDFLELRASFTGKRASLDHDLLYGLLGMLQLDNQIVPRYDRPVEEAYINFSRQMLQIPTSCDCTAFASFAFTSVRARYSDLPSWVIDHTIFEDERILSTTTYAKILAGYDHPQLQMSGKMYGLRFGEDQLILCGRFIDSISDVGQANLCQSSQDDRDFLAMHTWRDLVLKRKSPNDPYSLPKDYARAVYNWATAWLRTMTANRRLSGDERYFVKFTDEDIAILLSDASLDPSNLLLLQHTPTFYGINPSLEAQFFAQMVRPDLQRQANAILFDTCYRSRMFLTQGDYLGLANIDIQCGDRIFLSARCGRPVVLRPVENSVSKWGRTTYRIVSSCYLDGFMDGPDEGVEFPCEEVWIE